MSHSTLHWAACVCMYKRVHVLCGHPCSSVCDERELFLEYEMRSLMETAELK